MQNLNILICYKTLLSILSLNGIIHNISSLILIYIIFFHIISIFVFCVAELNKISKKIKDIAFGITNLNLIKKNKIKKNTKSRIVRNSKKNNKKTRSKSKQKKSKIIKNKSININSKIIQ